MASLAFFLFQWWDSAQIKYAAHRMISLFIFHQSSPAKFAYLPKSGLFPASIRGKADFNWNLLGLLETRASNPFLAGFPSKSCTLQGFSCTLSLGDFSPRSHAPKNKQSIETA
ncbi:hypothetical protein BSKO_09917 [Bryopsis sp. KO-2023]|nr:hypothetical protein BSKO_09917 [Bryopsis sp. KO-2023]